MGLLDDAIREHLELKRRRGADPAEIERAEREALGPARGQYQATDELDAELEPLDGDDALDEEAEDEWHEPLPDTQHDARQLPASDDDDTDVPHPGGHGDDEEPFPQDEPAARTPAGPASGSAHDPLEAETSEYDIAAEDDRESEDVLEETPDFLQDTPDHDRLWFEQRPPRDFDFDG
jgi:hypothetical protein